MTNGTALIQTKEDANWYLGIAEVLEPALPIDLEVERLFEENILGGDDETKRIVRKAVYEAARWAFDGPAREKHLQQGRRTTPEYFAQLQKRVDIMLDAYAEIHANLSGNKVRVALNYIEHEMAARLPEGARLKTRDLLISKFNEFRTFEKMLYDFRDLLAVGSQTVKPRRGRPKEPTYYFVSVLAREWFKLTGEAPVRIYDVLTEQEAGNFHGFCAAAANTVRLVVPIGSLDAAVRRVCEEWKVKEAPLW